ncbi:MAG: hypothetical protein A2504_05955 [Bdellovibrionales bacterium RIFOXYD12_FULL_39_22]|nr:MAG: hypothetical protein A2385_08275 [Bdellovibrionales bacterium RIFOXYB1_FULL_39_21]OFZ45301.1 MAG: hypothetical protein A2485_06265 [Bdellovibrionales bacterium RIFOXYC12_FULL_39_17]OFZ45510.1 MAG: hypothetical protein A2404_02855 [Bdellovibrionales bacterium RIFOXYC1_FULL_39_130]OFZ73732.1 MAG: hypothetical protein A2451_14845 [Bdellovibrionales bacterium RIFOXYC2_FULL_39_8]OFZ77371.1 MAG: hypothetical protein A2560_08445 [Bdellovibrionales bacterium RIFOXYD1_FULL_39_84]OFZ91500.1 MAG:
MCTCEFCNTEFTPRPQVKNPRACNNNPCQRLRQAANEREWRQLNDHLNSKEYHQIRRNQRIDKIKKINAVVIKSLSIGAEFLGLPIDVKVFCGHFEHHFFRTWAEENKQVLDC